MTDSSDVGKVTASYFLKKPINKNPQVALKRLKLEKLKKKKKCKKKKAMEAAKKVKFKKKK